MLRTMSLCWLVLASCSNGGRAAPADKGAIRWEAPIEVARGGGQRGEWRQNDSDYDYVDDTTVALADDGTAVVAWVDQARKEIFVERYSRSGSPIATPVAVSRTPAVFSWLPRLALACRQSGSRRLAVVQPVESPPARPDRDIAASDLTGQPVAALPAIQAGPAAMPSLLGVFVEQLILCRHRPE